MISQSPAAANERADRPSTGDRRRWVVGYLAVALPALLLSADGALAVARGWQPRFRVDMLIAAVVVAWLACVTALLALPAGRRFYARNFARLIALVASGTIAWLVGEWGVAAVLPDLDTPFHRWRSGITMVHRPNPQIMRGVGPESVGRYNAWGVRGSDPPPRDRAYRILCVGASSTACTYLDDAKTWPHVLADELHRDDPHHAYWVGNIGIPGYRTAQHLRFAQESPLVNEVDCLVVQTGINDFMSCLLGRRPSPPLWTRSNVRQLARTLVSRLSGGDTLVEDTGGAVYARRRAVRQAAAIDEGAPELDDCLKQFERQLHELVDVCRRRNVRLVFTTQPTLWRADQDAEDAALLWFGEMADGRFLSIGQLRAGMDRYNQALQRVCRRRGAELVDLSKLDGQADVFYDDCHFTELGARRVARLIADWFGEHPAYAGQEAPR